MILKSSNILVLKTILWNKQQSIDPDFSNHEQKGE